MRSAAHGGVGQRQRVVVHVAVTVVGLQVGRRLHDRVCLQEPAQCRVVDAAVHVDDAHVIKCLVAGKPFGGDGGADRGHHRGGAPAVGAVKANEGRGVQGGALAFVFLKNHSTPRER